MSLPIVNDPVETAVRRLLDSDLPALPVGDAKGRYVTSTCSVFMCSTRRRRILARRRSRRNSRTLAHGSREAITFLFATKNRWRPDHRLPRWRRPAGAGLA